MWAYSIVKVGFTCRGSSALSMENHNVLFMTSHRIWSQYENLTGKSMKNHLDNHGNYLSGTEQRFTHLNMLPRVGQRILVRNVEVCARLTEQTFKMIQIMGAPVRKQYVLSAIAIITTAYFKVN